MVPPPEQPRRVLISIVPIEKSQLWHQGQLKEASTAGLPLAQAAVPEPRRLGPGLSLAQNPIQRCSSRSAQAMGSHQASHLRLGTWGRHDSPKVASVFGIYLMFQASSDRLVTSDPHLTSLHTSFMRNISATADYSNNTVYNAYMRPPQPHVLNTTISDFRNSFVFCGPHPKCQVSQCLRFLPSTRLSRYPAQRPVFPRQEDAGDMMTYISSQTSIAFLPTCICICNPKLQLGMKRKPRPCRCSQPSLEPTFDGCS